MASKFRRWWYGDIISTDPAGMSMIGPATWDLGEVERVITTLREPYGPTPLQNLTVQLMTYDTSITSPAWAPVAVSDLINVASMNSRDNLMIQIERSGAHGAAISLSPNGPAKISGLSDTQDVMKHVLDTFRRLEPGMRRRTPWWRVRRVAATALVILGIGLLSKTAINLWAISAWAAISLTAIGVWVLCSVIPKIAGNRADETLRDRIRIDPINRVDVLARHETKVAQRKAAGYSVLAGLVVGILLAYFTNVLGIGAQGT